MRNLLALGGFEAEAEFSDFAGAPPAYGKEQTWIAQRGYDGVLLRLRGDGVADGASLIRPTRLCSHSRMSGRAE